MLGKRKRSGRGERYGSYGASVGRAVGGYAGGPFGAAAGGLVGGYAGGMIAKKTAGANKSAFSNESTLSTRHSVSKKRGAKLGKKNAKKTVKVSKSLRAKIGKVIEEKKVHGSWTQISYGTVERPASCSQTVTAINQPAAYSDYQGGWQFLPEHFLHYASVLFNEKPDTQGGRVINDDNNLGMRSGGETNPTAKALYGCNAKFNVNNSYEVYHMKNNTQQTLKIKMYTCSIKNVQGLINTVGITPQNTATTSAINDSTPIQWWIDSLATATGKNRAGADLFRLGMYPDSDPLWKKHWNYEVTDLILDPGQSHTSNIQGPKAQTLDFQKFYAKENFMTIQKFSRYTFFIVQSDLVQGGSENFGDLIAGRFRLGGTGRLLLERKVHASISVPESVGFRANTNVASGNVVELNEKSSKYFHIVYAPESPLTLQRIDEEQPATLES